MEWLGTNWQTIWRNTLTNMANIFANFTTATMKNMKGLIDYVRSGGTKFSLDTRGWTAAMDDVTKGTTDFTLPEIDDTDWDAKWRELEDKMNERRAALKEKNGKVDAFIPPDLQNMFDQINNGKAKAEIKVSMSDSVSAWKEGLLDAFKNTDVQKQTKLQQEIADNQKKQMDADKANTAETVKAIAYVGGGFY
jgi:hypothetical protein